MKRILALMFMAAFVIGLWAQDDDYLPFFEDGKVWESIVYTYGSNQTFLYNYTDSVCGDIEFQGKKCKKVRETDPFGIMDIIVFEKDRKIFYYDEIYEKFLLMMDFNLQVGDYAEIRTEDGSYFDSVQINEVGAVSIRGIERKVIKSNLFTWVEGIYCSYPLIEYPRVTRFTASVSRGVAPIPFGDFLECRKDGKVLCTREDLNLAPPASVTDFIVDNDPEGPIYDTMGRRVETPQPGRLYIRNGRKFMAKP